VIVGPPVHITFKHQSFCITHLLHWGCTDFPKMLDPLQTSGHQKSDMKQISN